MMKKKNTKFIFFFFYSFYCLFYLIFLLYINYNKIFTKNPTEILNETTLKVKKFI